MLNILYARVNISFWLSFNFNFNQQGEKIQQRESEASLETLEVSTWAISLSFSWQTFSTGLLVYYHRSSCSTAGYQQYLLKGAKTPRGGTTQTQILSETKVQS